MNRLQDKFVRFKFFAVVQERVWMERVVLVSPLGRGPA
jgi:hypothetical protein